MKFPINIHVGKYEKNMYYIGSVKVNADFDAKLFIAGLFHVEVSSGRG